MSQGHELNEKMSKNRDQQIAPKLDPKRVDRTKVRLNQSPNVDEIIEPPPAQNRRTITLQSSAQTSSKSNLSKNNCYEDIIAPFWNFSRLKLLIINS